MEKFSALLYVKTINGYTTEEASRRSNSFEDMTPIFPEQQTENGTLRLPGGDAGRGFVKPHR